MEYRKRLELGNLTVSLADYTGRIALAVGARLTRTRPLFLLH